jgi:predicted ATPase
LRLTRLHVENFKSLRDITIQLDPILTILIGRNEAGKSNVLDAITFVSEFIGASQQEYVSKRGGPNAVVFAGNPDGEIMIELELAMDEDEMVRLSEMLTISLDQIRTAWVPRWVYKVRFGWMDRAFMLISESIWTWINGQQIEYAKSSWQKHGSGQMHYYEAIENITNGFTRNEWKLQGDGGQAPAQSLLAGAQYQQRREWYPLKEISDYLRNISRLDMVRESPEIAKLIGRYRLAANAEDLPQVLHSLASSRRKVFDAILKDATTLIPALSEIRSQPVEGTDKTYLSATEQTWPQSEFLWRNIASGAKEVMYLLTFIHVAPEDTLLLVEEPGLNLHAEAIAKLRSIIERAALQQRKQVIATTHSLTLIDDLPFKQIIYLQNENGASKTLEIRNFDEAESILKASLVRKSSILAAPSSLLVLLVEGRDDVKIWRQFLSRTGVDVESAPIRIIAGFKSGGREEVVTAASFLSKVGAPISYYAILDGDGKDEIGQKLRQAGIPENNVHFLSKGEIEDYLAEPSAIAALTHREQSEVERILSQARGSGKKKFEDLVQRLGVSKASAETKELLVLHLPEIPDEVREIAGDIKSRLKTIAKG